MSSNSESPRLSTKPKWHQLSFLDDLSKHSWLRVTAFVLVFSVIGSYLVFKSSADAPVVATVQAEQMDLPRGASIVSDASASGGKEVQMATTKAISKSVQLSQTVSSIGIIAKGVECRNNWPALSVTIDGVSVLQTSVSSSAWNNYAATVNLGSGKHTVRIAYSGDTSTRCVGSLYVDVISFFGPVPATPQPTVSLSAGSTTVTSGQPANLTWSSLNATSCTASGAWTGTKPIAGSFTTPALTVSSTYSLNCTGAGGSASASVTIAVAPVATTPPPTTGAIWLPTADKPLALQWVLGDALNVNDATQMGLRDFNGNTLPAPDVYDIDGEYNTAATVSYLHSQGKKVICYFDAGVYETYRSDAYKFQALSPQIWGNADQGWNGSYWLDIRRVDDLQPIMQARMQMCKDKGFDAIEPDEITNWSNSPGFPISYNDQLVYNRAIASWAHNIGLSIGLKGDLEQAHDLVGAFDWTLNEQCYEYSECETVTNSGGPGADGKDYPGLQLFAQANKAVWVAEYKNYSTTQWATICSDSDAQHFNTSLYKLGLPNNGGRMPCPTKTTW